MVVGDKFCNIGQKTTVPRAPFPPPKSPQGERKRAEGGLCRERGSTMSISMLGLGGLVPPKAFASCPEVPGSG